MNRLAAAIPVPLLIALCIALDQATKWWAKTYLAPDGFVSFASDIFRLQYAENTGAFLSLGSSLSPSWRHIVFTVFVGVFLVALLAYLIFNRSLPAAYRAYLSLVCGGGLSNLIDRIVYGGHVVDFLNLGIGPVRTGIFNAADMAITTGAVLLAVDSLKKKPKEPSAV